VGFSGNRGSFSSSSGDERYKALLPPARPSSGSDGFRASFVGFRSDGHFKARPTHPASGSDGIRASIVGFCFDGLFKALPSLRGSGSGGFRACFFGFSGRRVSNSGSSNVGSRFKVPPTHPSSGGGGYRASFCDVSQASHGEGKGALRAFREGL
jgi:hypothetical protein